MIETKISLKDIKPYGLNPRKNFGDLKKMADIFSTNSLRPGEPVIPILVVKDGKKTYRIIDGERRYKAMLLNKTKECTCMVADSMDDANAVKDMLATDDKMRLSSSEQCKGIQQVLTLGVDPEVAAKISRYDVKKLRSVKALLDSGKKFKNYKTITIDELAANYDFPILTAELERAIEASGIERAESSKGFEYVDSNLKTAKELKAAVKKLKGDLSQYVTILDSGNTSYYWNVPRVSIYKKPVVGKDGNPQTKSEKELLQIRLEKQNKKAAKARAQWVADHIGTWDKDLKHVGDFCAQHIDYISRKRITAFNEAHGCNTPINPSAFLIVIVWSTNDWDELCMVNLTNVGTWGDDVEEYQRHVDMMEALAKDGYQINEEEQELVDLLKAFIVKSQNDEKLEAEK